MGKRDRRITMLDIARAAGVSVGTVSRVANQYRSVKPAVRARVVEEMQRLGYEPDLLARSLRTGATHAIGCLVPNVSIPFFSQTVDALERTLHPHGYTMLLANSHDRIERELEILSLFRGRRLDGMVVTVSSATDQALLDLLRRPEIPITLLQRRLDLPLDSVVNDHFGGVQQASRYLLELGHRRIAILTGPRDRLPGDERSRAYDQTLTAFGVTPTPELAHYFGPSPEESHRRTYQMLTSAQPPTAIMAGANQMLGVLRAANSLGIPVPERLSLISLGDMDLATLVTPKLTAVRWNNAEAGRAAAEILLARIRRSAGADPVHMVLPAELVLRDSCRPPP